MKEKGEGKCGVTLRVKRRYDKHGKKQRDKRLKKDEEND